jgi:hypothetical protein
VRWDVPYPADGAVPVQPISDQVGAFGQNYNWAINSSHYGQRTGIGVAKLCRWSSAENVERYDDKRDVEKPEKAAAEGFGLRVEFFHLWPVS